MSVHKIETVRGGGERRATTEHRLFALVGEHAGEPLNLQLGRPRSLGEGVTLTLADPAGNAMIEIDFAQRGAGGVTIDGVQVFEIAHCKPHQRIEVAGGGYVVLPPYGIFVRDGESADAKAKRLEALGIEAQAPAPVRKLPAKKAVVKPKKRSRKGLVMLASLLAAAGVGLAMLPSAEETNDAPVAEAKKTAPKKKAVAAPPPPAPMAPPPPAPAPVVAQDAPVEAKTEEARPLPPPPSKPSQVAAAPAPTPDKRPAALKAKKEAAPAPQAALTSLPPEREATVRKQIESYQLEAGFDPEGAAAKLQKLRGELPAHAAVRAEVDKALRSLQ